MSESHDNIFPPEYIAANKAQAVALKSQATEHGLRFEGYLVPDLAEWALNLVEKGVFRDPAEVVFIAMQVFKELQDHPDLQQELLRREIQKGFDDPGPSIPGEEALARVMEDVKRRGKHAPAVWNKVSIPE